MLGVLSIKSIILIDFLGALFRVITLFVFLTYDWGALGILLSSIMQGFVLIPYFMYKSKKKFGIKIRKNSLIILIREGISNFPSKISLVIQSFGIISIMVFFGLSNDEIAGMTIATSIFLMIALIPLNFLS